MEEYAAQRKKNYIHYQYKIFTFSINQKYMFVCDFEYNHSRSL